MNKILSLLVTALATAITSTTFAAVPTPVAVWDGDFSETIEGYTLNLNNNKLSDDNSTITITNSVGVTVDFASGLSGMTIMFRYDNLNLSTNVTQTLVTSYATDNNRTGVHLTSDQKPKGVWQNATWGNPASAFTETSGVLAFTYKGGTGTYLYYIGDAASQIYGASTLHSRDDSIVGCAIAGERGTSSIGPSTGMQIASIAIFNGVLSTTEMASYIWPSEIQTINITENTTVSAINEQVDSNMASVDVVVSDGVVITVDAPFQTAIPLVVYSEGSITLSADAQPEASYYSSVDFSGVEGALKRSWLSSASVGYNFNSGEGSNTSGALGGTAQDDWTDITSASGSDTTAFSDGLTKVTWSSKNLYQDDRETDNFVRGYLDDGNGVNITVTGLHYELYDVIIYASTDTDGVQLTAKTVNGVSYTYNPTVVDTAKIGTDAWGVSDSSDLIAYGRNAICVRALTGSTLTISSVKSGSNRGCISAIEILPHQDSSVIYCSLTDATASWDGQIGFTMTGTWEDGEDALLVVSNNLESAATFAFDKNITASSVAFSGSGDTTVTLGAEIDAIVGAYSFVDATGKTTVDFNWGSSALYAGSDTVVKTDKLGSTTPTVGTGNKITYSGTTGLDSLPFFVASESGTVVISAPYTNNSERLTMIGNHNAYRFGDGASVEVKGFALGNEGGVTQNIYQDGGSITLTSTYDIIDSNAAEFLIGHYSGCTTKLFNYGGTWICEGTSARLGWDGSLTEWHIGCGDANSNAIVTVKGIKTGVTRSNTAKLFVNAGGTLNLGSVGIQFSASANTLTLAGGTIAAYANTSIANGGTTTSTAGTTTTFAPADGVTLTVNPVIAGDGSLVIAGSGVVALTSAPTTTGSLTVADGATLTLGSGVEIDSDKLALSSGSTLRITVTEAQINNGYDASAYLVEGATIEFYEENGSKITDNVEAGVLTGSANIWDELSEGSWDAVSGWSTKTAPTSTSRVSLKVADAVISISDSSVAKIVSVEESATISGTAAALQAFAGRLTSISLSSGKTLTLQCTDGGEYTFYTAISGEGGIVISGGTATFTHASTYSGGTTVNSGILVRGNGTAFGAGGSTVTVAEGGTVDLNGSKSGVSYAFRIAGAGPNGETYALTGSTANEPNTSGIASITLTADATIGAITFGSNVGLNTSLAGYTLKTKGTVYTKNGNFINGGTVEVVSGTYNASGWWNRGYSSSLVVNEGAVYNNNADAQYRSSFYNIVNRGTIGGRGARICGGDDNNSGGRYEGSGTINNIELVANTTLDLSSGLNVTGTLTLGDNVTIKMPTVAEGDVIKVLASVATVACNGAVVVDCSPIAKKSYGKVIIKASNGSFPTESITFSGLSGRWRSNITSNEIIVTNPEPLTIKLR